MSTSKRRFFLIAIPVLFLCLCAACGPDAAKVKENYSSGLELYNSQQLEAAANEFRKVLDEDPDYTQARVMIGKIFYVQRKFDEAEAEFRSARDRDPASMDAAIWTARTIAAQSEARIPEAQAIIEDVLQNDNHNIEAWFLKGRFHESRDQIPDAIGAYRYGVQAGRSLGAMHYRLARLYQAAQLNDQAVIHLRAAAVIAADNPELLQEIRAAASARTGETATGE